MYLILVGLVSVLVVLLVGGNKGDRGSEGYQAQTNSEGEVTVEVTSIVLSDKENVQFKIVLNTHSVPLDKDLKDTSILFDDQNNQYEPISWSGGTGGHHLEGILTFPKLSKKAKSARLVIKDISDIDREFLFPL